MRIHPLIRIATQFTTAIGGVVLANALLGTTVNPEQFRAAHGAHA